MVSWENCGCANAIVLRGRRSLLVVRLENIQRKEVTHEVKRRHKSSKRGSGAASCKRAAQECMRDRAPSECVGKNLLSSSLSSSVSACPSAANQPV